MNDTEMEESETCPFCGQEMICLRGEANGLSCPNAFLHEDPDVEV